METCINSQKLSKIVENCRYLRKKSTKWFDLNPITVDELSESIIYSLVYCPVHMPGQRISVAKKLLPILFTSKHELFSLGQKTFCPGRWTGQFAKLCLSHAMGVHIIVNDINEHSFLL